MKSTVGSRKFRCIVPAHDWCGESPVWSSDHQALFRVDINRRLIHRWQLENQETRTWEFDEPVAALALTTQQSVFLVALASRLIFWNCEMNFQTDAGFRLDGWPKLRFNDGRADPRGSFWVGTMWNNILPDGGDGKVGGHDGVLYRFDPDGAITQWEGGIGIANTVTWSPDRSRFYFADTLANEINVYDYDPSSGAIANKRPFLAGFSRGLPDGSVIDAEGYLWNCRSGGSCVVRVAPDGEIDQVLEFPTPKPTSCTFGGKNLDTLFVTSIGLGAKDDPHAGGVFALEPGVRGLPENRFNGPVP
jgi:sugar lactone lactonase YvrE